MPQKVLNTFTIGNSKIELKASGFGGEYLNVYIDGVETPGIARLDDKNLDVMAFVTKEINAFVTIRDNEEKVRNLVINGAKRVQ